MKSIQCKNCANLKHDWCELVNDSPYPGLTRDCQYFRQKTNLDIIRSLSPKDLAAFMVDHDLWPCSLCKNNVPLHKTINPCNENECDKNCLEWLTQEVID